MHNPTTEHSLSTETNWVTTIFLAATLLVSLVTVPLYAWKFGIGRLEIALFVTLFFATGLSITVGYHRLFTHCTFRAPWPVRLFLALFGAATFEASALVWCSEHRYHHKYTDQDGTPRDPHSIEHGFLIWQHRHYLAIAISTGFFLPMAAGAAVTTMQGRGALLGVAAGFVFGACARIVAVHHATFLVNSATHMFGRQPYDSSNSSRDSGLLALITFGEGYHNFHHAFPGDYRIGSRFWHFDPGKWSIWLLHRFGLASNLRRLPKETIQLARIREARRRLDERLARLQPDRSEQLAAALSEIEEKLHELHLSVRTLLSEQSRLARERGNAQLAEIEHQLETFSADFQSLVRQWKRQRRALLSATA
jgi:stearoyl-CoA desaturase (delta-9 desaturase)